MIVIALTGGIGSGKTTVSEIFKSKNIPIIDTDIIARQLIEKNKPAYHEVIKLFGEGILDEDKNINRRSLRKVIFSSAEKRLQLENILHPLIWNMVKSELEEIRSYPKVPPYCIVAVPLLIENLAKNKPIIFDRILVIDVDDEIQIQRTMKRDDCDELSVKNVLKSQVSRQTRIDAADDVIENTGNLDFLNKNVEKLHKKYLELSK